MNLINSLNAMKKKIIFSVLSMAMIVVGALFYSYSKLLASSDGKEFLLENVEALSDGENGGSKCPRGCRNIGWGYNKILECDCNYDHFSDCNSWGC